MGPERGVKEVQKGQVRFSPCDAPKDACFRRLETESCGGIQGKPWEAAALFRSEASGGLPGRNEAMHSLFAPIFRFVKQVKHGECWRWPGFRGSQAGLQEVQEGQVRLQKRLTGGLALVFMDHRTGGALELGNWFFLLVAENGWLRALLEVAQFSSLPSGPAMMVKVVR